jgi:hypothetical protein
MERANSSQKFPPNGHINRTQHVSRNVQLHAAANAGSPSRSRFGVIGPAWLRCTLAKSPPDANLH